MSFENPLLGCHKSMGGECLNWDIRGRQSRFRSIMVPRPDRPIGRLEELLLQSMGDGIAAIRSLVSSRHWRFSNCFAFRSKVRTATLLLVAVCDPNNEVGMGWAGRQINRMAVQWKQGAEISHS